MRIGLFGGTFNPVHHGHLRVAKEVKDSFPLDQIIFFPSAIPPHKKTEKVVSAEDRMEMLRIAISETPDVSESFSISDIELKRSGPSYTIDTVKEYRLKMTGSNDLYLLMGTDAFFEIDTWKSYPELFRLISIIVMLRPDDDTGTDGHQKKALGAFIQSSISSDYNYSSSQRNYVHPENMPIYVHDVTPVHISATKIRHHIKKKISIQPMVPSGVDNYIKRKGLYV